MGNHLQPEKDHEEILPGIEGLKMIYFISYVRKVSSLPGLNILRYPILNVIKNQD
jgi:hypothetical protein